MQTGIELQKIIKNQIEEEENNEDLGWVTDRDIEHDDSEDVNLEEIIMEQLISTIEFILGMSSIL